MENFTRLDNLIITGLPLIDYSDAASTSANRDAVETSASTERAVLNFFNTTLNVPVESKDISIAHRLKSTAAQSLPNIIVRFSNRKARNDVYAARRRLQRSERRHIAGYCFIAKSRTHKPGGGVGIYVSDSLTYKVRADLNFSSTDFVESVFVELVTLGIVIGCV